MLSCHIRASVFVLKNFIGGERTVSVRDNPPLITHGVKSDVRGFWLSGQGCGVPCRALGLSCKHRRTNSLHRRRNSL